MKKQGEIINYIYQNSEMGIATIKQLLTVVEDQDFIDQLQIQYNEYIDINREAKAIIEDKGKEIIDIGTFDKIKTYLMINFQTMSDNSPSHIAEMLIIGSNMGIIQAIRTVRENKDTCESCVQLMKRLEKTELNNIEQLKKFL